MDLLTALLESPIAKTMAVVIGIIGGITAIFARAFPDPILTRKIALGALFIVGLFLTLSLFGWVGVAVFVILTTIIVIVLELARFIKRFKMMESWVEIARNGNALDASHTQSTSNNVEDPSSPSDSTCDPETVYAYSAARYGIGYRLLDVSCDVHYDGSAMIKRKVTVEAFSRMNSLETSLLIPETSGPGSWSEQNRLRVTSAPEQHYIVSAGVIKRIERKQFAQIVFAPELAEGKSLTFTMAEDLFPGIFAMGLSHKDLDKLNEKDYFGWNIDRPTRALHLKVYFPKRVRPRVFGTLVQYNLAFSGIQTAIYQYEEMKRLKDPILSETEEGRVVLALDVEYPMVGLMYILFWLPIPKKDEIPDDYTPYEIGLQNLVPQFDANHAEYTHVRDLEQRLIENITRSRDYSDSESLRTQRAEILRELDQLALSACKCSFQDLCR